VADQAEDDEDERPQVALVQIATAAIKDGPDWVDLLYGLDRSGQVYFFEWATEMRPAGWKKLCMDLLPTLDEELEEDVNAR
jgi:hypothetical protein